MFKKLFVVLFLAAILTCHAEDVVEPQQDVSGGSVSNDTKAEDLDRMLSTEEENGFVKATAIGETVETHEAEMAEPSFNSEKLLKQAPNGEKRFGNALDVIKTSRAIYRCGTSRGRRRCPGRPFCCPSFSLRCCPNECCYPGFNFCSRIGYCVRPDGLGICRFSRIKVIGTRCTGRVCCPARSTYNRCAAFRLSGGRVLVICVDSFNRVPCGSPPTPGTVCTNGRCCRSPLRCCAGGCCS